MARDGRWSSQNRVVGTAAGVFAVAVLAIAPAVACTPTANVQLDPSRGEAGSVIMVSGSVFDPGGAPVEVRWGGTGGDIVGRASVDNAGQFSLAVTVPRAAPGHYIVSATQKLNDGGYKRSAASFEVPGKAPASQSPARPSGDEAGTESRAQQPAPANMAAPAGSSSAPAANPAQPVPTPAPGPAPQPPRRVSSAGSPARVARAEPSPAGSTPEPVAAAAPADEPDAAISTELPESSVPPMAAVGDLWSGFGANGSPGLGTGRADGAGATAEEDRGTLLVGAGLVALATLMLLAAAVPVPRRRRSHAEVGNEKR